jgi:tetratricopeptide (TPR) repeat protein
VAGLDEDRALELTEALARHSLIYLDNPEFGPRSQMLESVRAFVAERLAARPDVAELQRRHADYYRALAERADRPLRGAKQNEWLERLEEEAGNLAAAVRWYLAHDAAPLPHLFRVLWAFWYLKDHMGGAFSWVGQLLPAADSLNPQARAELVWAAVVTANEVGDDAAALAARQRLESLLDTIQDPFLLAVCRLAMAWTSPISGDFDVAVREASVSMQQFRGQDEPFWTALAGCALGGMLTAVGSYDDATGPLHEARDVSDRFGYAWPAAWSRVQLGTLDIVYGQLDKARALLDEALDMSLAIHINRNVALCLVAFARLAFADGDPERAALLAGAAAGLRQRAGLRAWPVLRRGEAELVAQVRQAQGAVRFDEVFAAGSRLSQREAVAAVRDQRGTGTQGH